MAANTKKNSKAGSSKAGAKAKPARSKPSATTADARMAELEAESAKLPSIIRPEYHRFTTAKNEDVIIRKLSVGERDDIVSDATDSEGNLDWGGYVHGAVAKSIVFPELTYEQIPAMKPEDFEFIWDEVDRFSYRDVQELIKTFRKPDASASK